MKELTRKDKTPMLVVIGIVIFIAGLLDIKYKGLFYKSLPKPVQLRLTRMFK